MSFFHDFFARFTSAVRTIFDFILPYAESDAGKVLAAILPIAEGIVGDIGKGSLSSADKRAAAFQQIGDAAKKAAIAAGQSDINLAIEMAVAKVKTGN